MRYYLFAAFVVLILLSSCSVEKRHYRPGFYTSSHSKVKSNGTVEQSKSAGPIVARQESTLAVDTVMEFTFDTVADHKAFMSNGPSEALSLDHDRAKIKPAKSDRNKLVINHQKHIQQKDRSLLKDDGGFFDNFFFWLICIYFLLMLLAIAGGIIALVYGILFWGVLAIVLNVLNTAFLFWLMCEFIL
jgi:hypothetical protein